MNRNLNAIRSGANPLAFRPHLENLEDRSVPATFMVTTALDVVDPADGKRSLREAIAEANATPEADLIVLPAGVFRIALAGVGEDGNVTGDFDITGSVTIRGAGAGKTLINGRQLDRVFDIRGIEPGSIGVVLEKLQVRNGKVDDDGGGIRVGNANLIVRDAAVVGNQASGNGGGLSNFDAPGTGNVTLVRTTVARNVAELSGGGLMVFSFSEGSVLAVWNSTVRGNVAGGGGGGINGSSVILHNSTVSNNYAADEGGGIDADMMTATNCTFSGNYAVHRGGGIFGGTLKLFYCTVAGNIAEDGRAAIAPFRALTLYFCTVGGNSRTQPPTFIVTTPLDVVDPADDKLSLREAITAANATLQPDTILLPAGVFKISRSGAGEDGNTTGDFDITSPITIRGAGAGQTFINGQQLDRVFDIRVTSTISVRVNLQKLQVRNGKVTGDGGGIQVIDAELIVRDAVIAGNQASGNGGGVSHASPFVFANFSLVRSTVALNVAGTNGGGIYAEFVDLTNSTVRDNSAEAGGGIYAEFVDLTNTTVRDNSAEAGGGVYTTSSASLTNSTFSGNEAGANGGGFFTKNFASLTNSTFSGNEAGANGGGVYITNFAFVNNSMFSGNTANGNGGGVFAESSTALTNSTFSGNSAGGSGGGVYAKSAGLLSCTIVKNSAQTGGGVFHNPGDPFSVQSTIIALNLIGSGGSGPDVSGAFTSNGHNLIGNGTGGTGFTNGANGDIVGTSAAPIDPKIGDLKNNGGRTMTHALLAGSPAIDAGDSVDSLTTDQRGLGFPRKKDGNGDGIAVVDIGAFER